MVDRSPGQERRKFPRLSLNLMVWYKALNPEELCKTLGPLDQAAITLDISPFGMAFMSTHNMPAFSDLSLKFVVFGSQPSSFTNLVLPIEVNARVCSCTSYGDNAYRVGVLFNNIDPAAQQKLACFIRESLGLV